MRTTVEKLRIEALIEGKSLPFPSLLGAAEYAGYEEDRLMRLSPSMTLREEEAAKYLASIGARWEDTQHGPVVMFP